MNALGLALLAGCIVGETARELCFKYAAGSGQGLPLRHPLLWAGVFLGAAEVLMWIATLQHLAPAVALPLMALTFATVPLAAQLLLRERLRTGQILGVALIGVGTFCVGLSGTLT